MVLVVKVGLGKARAKPKPAQIHVTNAASRLQPLLRPLNWGYFNQHRMIESLLALPQETKSW